eukprot:TRINITY_DN81352_c0_g1_i1.p1 TRINITY_DN81352_c0_g1~~TRINITY_DN81352_c0_g1_i1.p1  ORF type:complete len:676 (+),score=100.52 TRINITY_DN81352_c0_g1_i1:272-2299(+)
MLPQAALWLVFACTLLGSAGETYRPQRAAELVRQDFLPLRTYGRFIVDTQTSRVKLACVNWAGAYSDTHVVGGLQVQPLRNLTRLISEMGFNCVRLPYSTQAYLENPMPNKKDLAANPALQGLPFQELFDEVVQALTSEGLMVIINNHLSVAGWCCSAEQDEGLWYVPRYNESQWTRSLTGLARRYKHNPLVVAFDIRNELHDTSHGVVTWGDGNLQFDWAAAAERAGNEVLKESPNKLIVVSALCFGLDLRGLKHRQVNLTVPHRVVYEVHNYIFSQIATNLVSKLGVSWTDIEQTLAGWAMLFLLIAMALHRVWKWAGKPMPPQGICQISFGSWLATVFLVFSTAFGVLAAEERGLGCSHYGTHYFMPICYICLLAAGWSLLVSAWGYHIYHTKNRTDELDDRCWDLLNTDVFATAAGALWLKDEEEDIASEERQALAGPELPLTPQSSSSSSPSRRRRARNFTFGWERSSRDLAAIWVSNEREKALQRHGLLEETTEEYEEGIWDTGHCLGMQVFVGSVVLVIVLMALASAAALGDSYIYLQSVFDWTWGFALQDGYSYTAPVWMGEFGTNTRGRYWMHLLSYLSARDVDFAYWSLDGLKHTQIAHDDSGHWVHFTEPRWLDETFGLLNADYYTIRHPWKLLDLQAIMSSPAGWTADDYPCDRAVLGNACGG